MYEVDAARGDEVVDDLRERGGVELERVDRCGS